MHQRKDSQESLSVELFPVPCIMIPHGVTTIGNAAFSGCKSLESIHIPHSVTHIGDYAFFQCTALCNIQLPKGIDTIGNKAFAECVSLTEIHIPEGVTTLGDRVFFDCESLKTIHIPESVTEIGMESCYSEGCSTEVFPGCESLTICGKTGSYAEQYAKDNGIPFEVL